MFFIFCTSLFLRVNLHSLFNLSVLIIFYFGFSTKSVTHISKMHQSNENYR